MASSRTKLRLAFALVLLLAAALIFELGSYLAILFLGKSPLTMSLLYRTPEVGRAEYEDYLARRDPKLGWPPPDQIGTDLYDASGSRPIPAFPEPGTECVSLYGDSFTYASDVEHEEAWSNRLSERLGCRVANFGVGGYGTDQAYLRFEGNDADRAQVTILGVFPTNVLRNLTRNAYFVFGVYPTSFKPRFSYSGGELRQLPMPEVPVDRLDEYLESPEKFIGDDLLMPGTRYGPTRVKFPFTLTLLRTSLHPRVVSWLRGRPSWLNYLSPGDPSTGHEVLMGIIDRFADECDKRRKRCAVLLFSTPNSYEYLKDRGVSAFHEIRGALEARGIGYVGLADEIAGRLGTGPYCDLIASADTCAGHFNARGNELVADIMHDFLVEKAWLD